MHGAHSRGGMGQCAASEPIFNVPAVVTAIIAVLLLIHARARVRAHPEQDDRAAALFAFVPERYGHRLMRAGLAGRARGGVWTFVTYAFLHAELDACRPQCRMAARVRHAGRAALRRGALPCVLCRHGGGRRARASSIVYLGEPVPMVGASAAISGFMAAAMRFAFQRGGPLDRARRREPIGCRRCRCRVLTQSARARVSRRLVRPEPAVRHRLARRRRQRAEHRLAGAYRRLSRRLVRICRSSIRSSPPPPTISPARADGNLSRGGHV